ncbi:phosphopantetheine-binding protein [Streptomyces sp. NPDC052109]|uniref:phosphopantetheine-binding protein n=1 Tax=Streptomyces sp. NPDC052109 TaxID=3155527 RepID=UPI0034237E3C
MLKPGAVKGIVIEHITELLEEAGVEHGEITGAEPLNGVGLSSLLLARLIIQLETDLDVDPFAEEDLVVSDLRTVDDLVDAYDRALSAAIAV